MTPSTTQITPSTRGPALAMLDIDDVPLGIVALDALVKEADVQVYSAGTVQAGRYLILFGGEVGPVEVSFGRALSRTGASLVDAILLPYAEPRIAPSILEGQQRSGSPGDTLGVLQTATSPTMLRAVDAALKGAEVELMQLRIADGLGGRAVATLWGDSHDVEAALELAEDVVPHGQADGWSAQVIRNVDSTVAERVAEGTHFFGGWRG
jgi:microcompartment protein CcmL/EutN